MRPGIDVLAGLAFLSAFPADQLARLNDLADLARVGPDEVLFRPGDALDQLSVLLAGHVVETQDIAGGLALTDVIVPVAPLALGSAMRGLPTPTGARTITSVRLVLLPVGELRRMIAEQPARALPLLEHTLAALRAQTVELCRLKLRSSVQRLADFLLDRVEDPDLTPARFVLPYEKRYLAAKIGCSQENLSRAFAALRRFGVESERGSVVLRDVAALRAYVAQGRRDPG